MPWTVEYVEEFGQWLLGLPEKRQDQIFAAILLLQRDGPALRRPKVGKIVGSRHENMKELIPQVATIGFFSRSIRTERQSFWLAVTKPIVGVSGTRKTFRSPTNAMTGI